MPYRTRSRANRQLHLPIADDGVGGNDFTRAGGGTRCRRCGRKYVKHPMAYEPKWLDWDGRPYLHRLCGGRLVKL